MKNLVLTLWILLGISTLHAKINTAVSILPQKTFVEAIGGDKVNVALMIMPGNSPHTYEPKPSQMKDIAQADIYFSIGVEFEKRWLEKFTSLNKKMKIVALDKGIEKIEIVEHSHGEEKHHDDNHHEGTDPHIWLSPTNAKLIAKNIYEELIAHDKENKSYYSKNYELLLDKITATDKEIKKILIDVETGSKFMIFHPAWGYFAHNYRLEQLAIEAGGKNPKPKQVMHLIEEAKHERVKAIFTAPEFSDSTAKQIASEVGVPVIKMSPLAPNWSENLIKFAKAIANK